MSNYLKLCENLKDLKLTQINLKLDEYITKVNEDQISLTNALYELTAKEIEVKNYNATNAMLKVAGFPHLNSIVNILGNSYRTASALSKISNKDT